MRRLRCAVLAGFAVFLGSLAALGAAKQDPPQPPPPPPEPPAATGSSSSSKPGKKDSHANDFLILGTVFTDKGYAFPAVELRVRRTGEKKFHWDGYTNSRGEFAIRVPQGTAYEMVVHAKGFTDQTRPLDAKSGISETRLVFRMELVPPKEKK